MLVAHFTIHLIAGICLMLTLMPRKQVTSGFFRIQMLLLLGLGALYALTTPVSMIGPVLLCSVAFISSVLWTLESRRAGTAMIFLVAAISLVELVFCSMRLLPNSFDFPLPVYLASEVASAAILGGAMTGMLLGHWYLTAPGMPLAPLLRMNQALGGATALRLALSTASLCLAGAAISGQTYWIWLGLRWLSGIIGPICVVVMVRQILRYRNTQAATGVLFVGVILTFIGELTADLLFHELHRPF